MATAKELTGLGIPPLQATAIGQSRNASLTATGSSSSDAALVVSAVTTLATSGAAGVKLPLAGAKGMYVIRNNSGNAQTVYPYSAANTINGATSVSLTSAKVGLFVPHEDGWMFVLGA